MRKMVMVAQREFVENMRTKTFWIGVLAAPIGIVFVYGLMFLLMGKTDLRKYAVLDNTKDQWFSTAVNKRRNDGDFQKILDLAKAPETEEQEAAREEFAIRVQKKLEELEADHPVKRLYAEFEKAGLNEEFDKAKWDAGSLPEEAKKKSDAIMLKWIIPVMLNERDRELAVEFVGGLTMEDYVAVEFEQTGEGAEKALNQMLRDKKIFAYFVLNDPLSGGEKSKYVSNNFTDFQLRRHYERQATEVVRDHHIKRLRVEKNLSKSDVKDIKATFSTERKQVTETGEEKEVEDKDTTRSFAPLVFVYILWIAIVVMAQMLLTNTVEEKSNRIIEVLLSSVSPTELMHGKIYGIALTGLTIIGSWTAFLIIGVKLAPHLLPPNAATRFAEFGIDQIVQDPVYLTSFLAYFITGYLFYAAILVAIGSVCNSLKEAQNLFQPVMFALFVPFVVMFPITRDPNGTLAMIITYIPLYTPFAMMNRAGGPPPLWEYAASSAMILVSLWVAFRGAAKVFRVGVLMTGKPPKLKEIWRWMRAPVK